MPKYIFNIVEATNNEIRSGILQASSYETAQAIFEKLKKIHGLQFGAIEDAWITEAKASEGSI